jgi:hypothetical protein
MKHAILIVLTLSCYCTFGQTLCDGSMPDSTTNMFIITEVMPKQSLEGDQMDFMLNNSINIGQYNLTDGTSIYLHFIVNCRGECFNYSVLRPVNNPFEEKLISVFQTNIT